MVLLIQLAIFVLTLLVRGRFLLGKHLHPHKQHPEHLDYISQHKGRTNARHIGLTLSSGIPFIIKRERWYHRFLKRLGIAKEIDLGVTAFDRSYFITTDHPGHLERANHAASLKDTLQALFALPVKSLHATPQRIWCVVRRPDLEQSDAYFAKHRDLLKQIAQSLTSTPDYSAISQQPKRSLSVLAFTFLCLHAALLSLALIGGPSTLADSIDIIDTMDWAVTATIPTLLTLMLWATAIILLFRGSSWVCWVISDFLLCGVIGILVSGLFITREANIHLPQPEPHWITQPVIHRVCTLECKKRCGKHCTRTSTYRYHQPHECTAPARAATLAAKQASDPICQNKAWFEYTLQVPFWHEVLHEKRSDFSLKNDDIDTPDRYTFSTEAALFDQTQIGTQLTIPIHQGALGIEWTDIGYISIKQQ